VDEKPNEIKATSCRMAGIVIPSDWDETGNVLALTLQADNEEEFLLDGKNLNQYIQHRVDAVGFVDFQPDGRHRFKVRSLNIID
jgi:hypothetical protein